MQDVHSHTQTFSEEDKLKALSIINIFETSRPMGDAAAVAVLDDGAGVSYGIAQFTHRSGSLAAVVDEYLATGCPVAREILFEKRPLLGRRTPAAIERLAADTRFKRALEAAAVTVEMKTAQRETAFRLYLNPAIDICERRGFVLPLSLAVVYDGVVHGAFDRLAEKTQADTEKAWIMSYVRRRHLWLTNIARLKKTAYRTRFFLEQLAIGNWELRLPMNVNGFRLAEASLANRAEPPASAGGIQVEPATAPVGDNADTAATPAPPAHADGSALNAAVDQFDRVDSIVSGVIHRTDRVKSLWTTVGGTLWQAAWAVFGFLAGLPREVWIVVALIAGLLTVMFLYRQIILGNIREQSEPPA
ncbi:MAG: chitosanase [Chloracidobacterium sp.]|nr:chitosanase [Chloracidobacterium sp.]